MVIQLALFALFSYQLLIHDFFLIIFLPTATVENSFKILNLTSVLKKKKGSGGEQPLRIFSPETSFLPQIEPKVCS